MNFVKIGLGAVLVIIAIAGTLLSEGLLLPFMLPIALFGFVLMGVKVD